MDCSKNEEKRLDALRRRFILDTSVEHEFENIIDLVQATFSAPMAAISFIDTRRQWFKAKRGLTISETKRKNAFCDYTIKDNHVLAVPDANQDVRFKDNPFVVGDPNIQCYLGAPLKTKSGHNIGSICVMDTKTRTFSQHDQDCLANFAKLVTTQLELREEALYDGLTNALSRKAFMDRVNQSIDRFKRHGHDSVLIILDIDYFKNVNDTYGHSIGDKVLESVVKTLSADLRRYDSIGRLGGEEFGILLDGVSFNDAVGLIERMHKNIHSLVFDDAPDLNITASMGCADVSEGSGDATAWSKVADARLYDAKRHGRDRLVGNSLTHERHV